ncbi:50S ribosomal protein L25 [Frankliniella fusca]|uniref:50S ribosomal protein L25 n=1 Tax=Frankliniella fusca TaxID=407009 RepID=A0AAE1HA16_9NEOP|nr:50S ribosomal protein L25 [Frankliniella fusca]
MEELFIKMFKRQHSPSSALESLKYDLQEEYGKDYFRISADGARCPNLQWVYNLYYKHFDKVYGATSGREMLQSLEKHVDEYNSLQKMKCAVVEEFQGEIILALCSPMMKRVLTNLKSTRDIMFVDSSGCMDHHNSRVFLMLSPSVAGALPVGVMIMSSEKEVCIKRGLELFLDMIPDNAFAGRGRLRPLIIMTDDSKYERSALQDVFPFARLLLCLFHVFQAFWRYLWDTKHKVSKDDRPYIYNQFKDCGYTNNEEKFESLYCNMIEDDIAKKYAVIIKHLDDYKRRAAELALCHHRDIMIRGHHTDNYAEANIKVIKTKILNRIKAFNIPQLFDFLTRKLEAYFERRISAVINNRVDNYTASRYFIDEDKLKPLTCSKIHKDLYLVKNSEKKTEYTVDTALELCTCEAGVGGALCKHLYAVVKQYNLSSSQVLRFADPASKVNLHFIMTGSKFDEEFFQNLMSATNAGPADSSFVQDLVDS